MTTLLWILLIGSAVTAVLAGLRLWQQVRRPEVVDITDEVTGGQVSAAVTGGGVIVERLPTPPPNDPTGSETAEVDLDEADDLESSLPSTDPATVEADEFVLTDPIDVHHHHH